MTKDIVTFRGTGDATDIRTALNELEITPVQDRNSNNLATIGGQDLNFTTTLTTYTQSGIKDVVSTDFSGDIEPVTDPVTTSPTISNVDEDVKKILNISLDTVDNSFGQSYATIVQNSNGDPLTSIDFTYTGSSDSGNGEFEVTLFDKNDNPIHFRKGETHSVDIALNLGGGLSIGFLAAENESGQAHFTYDIFSKEDNASNIINSHESLDIDIAPIADGINIGGDAKAEGREDEYIQIKDANGNPITGDLIDKLPQNTTPEILKTIAIDDVPTGYLVYYGTGHTLAQNLGDNGSGKNSWNIPLSGGSNPVPEIYLKAPAQIGGVTEILKLVTGVEDGGQQVYSVIPINVTVEAVADPITINPSPTGGVEGSQITLNFNSNSQDVDGSEKYEITLKGLNEGTIFYFHGVEIDSSKITFTRGATTADNLYTISKDLGIDYSSVDDLSIIHNDITTDISASIKVYDGTDTSTTPTPDKRFQLTITQQHGSSGDDILLYDNRGVDGGDGDDTIVFGTNWNNQNSINLSSITNIERFNLTEHGDHSLTINSTDATSMTDSRNILTIDSDNGDTINLKDDNDNIWQKSGNNYTNIYDNTKVTMSGGGTTTIKRAIATAGDDVIGYDGTVVIDAQNGNDRIVVLNDIDFSGTSEKMKNTEILDIRKSGDIKLDNLSVADVKRILTTVTTTANILTIEANNANDKIKLSNEWIDEGNGLYKYDDGGGNADSIVQIQVNGGATVTTTSTIIDGMVEGLRYATTSGIIGMTDSNGSFEYAFEDSVMFNIGNIEIGSIDMSKYQEDKIFLQDLAGTDRSDLNDEYVENMAVLLQSLDSDDSDKILITTEMHNAFSDDDFNLSTISEEELITVIQETGREAISEDQAMEHVEDMLIEYGDMSSSEFDERATDTQEDILSLNDEDENIDLSALDEDETISIDIEDEQNQEQISYIESDEKTENITDVDSKQEESEDIEESKYNDITLDQVIAEEEISGDNLNDILPGEDDTLDTANNSSAINNNSMPDPTVKIYIEDQINEVA